MPLSSADLKVLTQNSLSIENAKLIGAQIAIDPTVKGIFPKGASGDFSNPNVAKFKSVWCSWWSLASKLLDLAKLFQDDRTDDVIDALLALGKENCS